MESDKNQPTACSRGKSKRTQAGADTSNKTLNGYFVNVGLKTLGGNKHI